MSTGVIKKVAGPLVIAEGMRDANMFDVVRVSEQRLIGEIIEMHGDEASIQVYEETSGLGPGEPVESMDVPMSVELGPGLIASIYDGIQRPLDDIMKISGNNLKRGVEVPSLKRNLKWEFVPTVKVGDEVETGDVIGTVQETVLVQQKIMVPYGIKGTIKEIKEGTFTVEDIVAVVETEKGEKELTMMQKWPVRRGRPYKKKLPPEMPLVTGQRVIDTFFPIAKGGVAAVPGPFGSGEKISPLGFVNGDFIYGKMKSEDAGKKASGESITPMYELEIRNSKNKKVASYSFVDKGIYISDILIDDNMVTLNRVEKSGDIYNVTSQEFITNNEERKDTAIKTEVYTTALMEKQMRITFAEGAGDKSVKVIRPNQLASKNELEMVLADNSESVKYYVYGVGELAGIYDKASYAIQKAQKISGVVISSDQKYVWEKGNRDLAYSIEDVVLSKEGEETSLEACERYMKTYDAQKVDLTGCTLYQVLYVINRGCPVIALTSADHAILLTGYTKNDITYIDPENGESQTVSISEMEGMVSGSGNTFIGYIK